MKIYVATKYENRLTAAHTMALLRGRGHIITYDWTDVEQESPQQAQLDLQGVLDCDALLMLAGARGEYNLKGTWVEFGVAAGAGKPIYVIGSGADSCIFSKLPNVTRIPTIDYIPIALP